MTEEDKKYRQGRPQHKVENTYKFMEIMISFLMIFVFVCLIYKVFTI